jgi:hypothetical protein
MKDLLQYARKKNDRNDDGYIAVTKIEGIKRIEINK